MGCACLFALLAAAAPRLALILMWLFTPWVNRAFENLIVPLLGLIFLPLTTVLYVLLRPGGLSSFEWLLIAVAFLIDLGAYGGGIFGRRR
jgi:CDP-diglyceride synthetase